MIYSKYKNNFNTRYPRVPWIQLQLHYYASCKALCTYWDTSLEIYCIETTGLTEIVWLSFNKICCFTRYCKAFSKYQDILLKIYDLKWPYTRYPCWQIILTYTLSIFCDFLQISWYPDQLTARCSGWQKIPVASTAEKSRYCALHSLSLHYAALYTYRSIWSWNIPSL